MRDMKSPRVNALVFMTSNDQMVVFGGCKEDSAEIRKWDDKEKDYVWFPT
jgi:hypothetical protein